MSQYLIPDHVLFILSHLIAETGGAHGIRDVDTEVLLMGDVRYAATKSRSVLGPMNDDKY
jgi:hypothetical protein